jgi:hypothetical protein
MQLGKTWSQVNTIYQTNKQKGSMPGTPVKAKYLAKILKINQ